MHARMVGTVGCVYGEQIQSFSVNYPLYTIQPFRTCALVIECHIATLFLSSLIRREFTRL